MSYQFGLLGNPIKHSLSPWIHGEFFKRTNLEGTYAIIEIDPQTDFDEAMKQVSEMNLNGFNVTAPYKEKIITYLDEIDDGAKLMGAVNTVLCKNGRWIGYNTDGTGYMRALQSKFPHIKNEKKKNILLLGAGGAAKGIYHALLQNHYTSITIANRSIERAEKLLDNNFSGQAITLAEAERNAHNYDIIIQTSSVGMKPTIDQEIILLTNVKEHAIVSDIVYQPILTKFLAQALSLGANIHFGHTMLLYQAQYAFEIWTDKQPTMDHLDTALQKILEG